MRKLLWAIASAGIFILAIAEFQNYLDKDVDVLAQMEMNWKRATIGKKIPFWIPNTEMCAYPRKDGSVVILFDQQNCPK